MAAKRKDDSKHDTSEATTKLTRLLETEIELEAMLKDTRQEAKELVEAAQVAADARVKEFESQLEGEEAELRERIARDRDQKISSIQNDSRQEAKRLDESGPIGALHSRSPRLPSKKPRRSSTRQRPDRGHTQKMRGPR